jgi:uncharacterized RDD family membrane protein YckC
MLSFTFRYAPVWRRAIAMLIDVALLVLADTLLLQPFIDLLGLRQSAGASIHTPLAVTIVRTYGVWLMMAIVLAWLYFAKQESSQAQATIGKRFMGLMVFGTDEERLTFAETSARFFSKLISGATLLIGFLSAFWDPERRSLHDHISRSIVVCSNDVAFQPATIEISEQKTEKPAPNNAGLVSESN